MDEAIRPLWFRKNGDPIFPIRGGDGTEGSPGGDGDDDGEQPPAGAAVLTLTPEQVRAHPEFRALKNENRKLARQKGQADTAAEAARTEAQEARQAAEAREQAAVDAEITDALGAEGTAFWEQFAELSQTDQAAAARLLAKTLKEARAQSAATAGAPAAGEPAKPPEENVNGNATAAAPAAPPPPTGGVDGSSPLGAAAVGEDTDKVIDGLEGNFRGIVDRVQDPIQRNRVTMKDRAAGAISYLGAAYLKAIRENAPRSR